MVALDGITQVQQHIAVVIAANFLHNGGCRRAGGVDAVGRGTGAQRGGEMALVRTACHAVGLLLAVEAPFLAQHLRAECLAGGSPNEAESVKGLHQGHRVFVGKRTLKGAQGLLTESLLVEEHGKTFAVQFLIVAGYVLDAGGDATALHSGQFGGGVQVGQDGIL